MLAFVFEIHTDTKKAEVDSQVSTVIYVLNCCCFPLYIHNSLCSASSKSTAIKLPTLQGANGIWCIIMIIFQSDVNGQTKPRLVLR